MISSIILTDTTTEVSFQIQMRQIIPSPNKLLVKRIFVVRILPGAAKRFFLFFEMVFERFFAHFFLHRFM